MFYSRSSLFSSASLRIYATVDITWRWKSTTKGNQRNLLLFTRSL